MKGFFSKNKKTIRGIILILAFIAGLLILIFPFLDALYYYYEDIESGWSTTYTFSNVYTFIFTGSLNETLTQVDNGVSSVTYQTEELKEVCPILLTAFIFSLLGVLLTVACFILITLKKEKIISIL